MANQFERWHPLTQFIYFLTVIVIMTVKLNPLITLVTFFGLALLGFLIARGDFLKMSARFFLPASLIAIVINPLFSHEGATILAYFPDGNPFTLESVLYGIASGLMICGMCFLFYSFNTVMTSDRIMYLTGRLFRTLSLIISMTLRFIPEFKRQLDKVKKAPRCLGLKQSRLKDGIDIMNSMIMWSFEKSIDRSDSMRARGYGIRRRTSFHIFTFTVRDIYYIALMLIVSGWYLTMLFTENIYVTFYPLFYYGGNLILSIISYVLYSVLVLLPSIDIILEEIKWKSLQ